MDSKIRMFFLNTMSTLLLDLASLLGGIMFAKMLIG